MSTQTPDEALGVLARQLQVEPGQLSEWTVKEFREGYLIKQPQMLMGSPMYLVLGEQVGLVNLAHANTSTDAVYQKLVQAASE